MPPSSHNPEIFYKQNCNGVAPNFADFIMHPKHLQIGDFTYPLPDERIARHPLSERDQSKLLVYKNGGIEENIYRDIDQYLPAGSLLVFNNTKVVEARLLFTKASGGVIEIFCLEPGDQYADIATAMSQKKTVFWKCMVGGASKWKQGMVLLKKVTDGQTVVELNAEIRERLSDCFIIKLSWTPAEYSFAEILHAAGKVPLPPYLHRDVEATDKERYQTVYARYDGSVAAPTAGLHFTNDIFKKLTAKNISTDFVTLHVGAGTFKPVKSETIRDHEMHSEFLDVSLETIENIYRNNDRKIFAVGTTSLRLMESLYWMGIKVLKNHSIAMNELPVLQWEPYETSMNVQATVALKSLIDWMNSQGFKRLITKTQIMIAPGYELKIASGIITNFHQPQSTLLLLIAAIVGEKWKDLYAYALQHDFRFLSYGDGCLIFKNEVA